MYEGLIPRLHQSTALSQLYKSAVRNLKTYICRSISFNYTSNRARRMSKSQSCWSCCCYCCSSDGDTVDDVRGHDKNESERNDAVSDCKICTDTCWTICGCPRVPWKSMSFACGGWLQFYEFGMCCLPTVLYQCASFDITLHVCRCRSLSTSTQLAQGGKVCWLLSRRPHCNRGKSYPVKYPSVTIHKNILS